MNQHENQADFELLAEVKQKFEMPKKYNVIFYNDDYTPMDFVTSVLTGLFGKTKEEAEALTYKVDAEGKAIVGQYAKEIAKTKTMRVKALAEHYGHPLKCDIEMVPEVSRSPKP